MARSRRASRGVDLIPVYFATERAVRRRPGPRRLGPGAAPDRAPRRRDDRGDPRLLRWRVGLAPPRRRPHRRRSATRSHAAHARPRTTTRGPTAGPSSGSRRSSGRGSCRTGRRRSGCPVSWRPSCWSSTCLDRRPAGVLLAGVLAALLAPFQFFAFPATYLIVLLYVVTTGAWRARTVVRDAALFLAPVVLAGAVHPRRGRSPGRRRGVQARRRLERGTLRATGRCGRLFFYLTNLGIPFVLAVVAALAARRSRLAPVPAAPGWSRCSSSPTWSGSARSTST